jgi:DNA-binding transcriptional ArsR family regulator
MLQDDCEPVREGWWTVLGRDDLEAWRRLLRLLLPLAMQTVRNRFGLIQLHAGNEASAEAALYSAWSSFQRHYHEDDFQNLRDLESLAGHLVRIAYNRWQRDRNARRKVDRAVAESVVRNASGQEALREYADPSPGPDERVVADELAEYLWQAVDLVKEGLSPTALRAVQAYLDDLRSSVPRTQSELARSLGMSQAAVSRHLNAFKDRLGGLLEESEKVNAFRDLD